MKIATISRGTGNTIVEFFSKNAMQMNVSWEIITNGNIVVTNPDILNLIQARLREKPDEIELRV